jgi:soluble lytic murein transglycosylase-like protein
MTAAVLAIFCATWPASLPRNIDRAAARAGAPSELAAATVGAESTCNRLKVSRLGAVSYGQILPGGSAAARHTAKQLRQTKLNLRLTAEHLTRCLKLCGGDWDGAVALYSGVAREKVDGVPRCQSTKWSRYVVAGIERARAKFNHQRRS